MTFKTSFAIAALTAMIGFSAAAESLNANVIIRYNNTTGEAEQLKTTQKLTSKQQALEIARTGDFESIAGNVAMTELDKEGGASSWYWDCGNNFAYTPQYYYYGSYYQPYFRTNYLNYSYYYYGSRSYYRNNWWY